MPFDVDSFFFGMLVGMLMFGIAGGFVAAMLVRTARRINPYAPKTP
jgi:hypothetical protein